MIEIEENILNLTEQFDAICIPTNGVVKKNGLAVMGAGLARVCAEKWPETPKILGECLTLGPNVPYQIGFVTVDGDFKRDVFVMEELKTDYLAKVTNGCFIFSFPTKNNFKDPSIVELIKESCHFMTNFANQLKMSRIALPRVGCGLGGLDYQKVVKPILRTLDDRFYVVSPKGN